MENWRKDSALMEEGEYCVGPAIMLEHSPEPREATKEDPHLLPSSPRLWQHQYAGHSYPQWLHLPSGWPNLWPRLHGGH